APSCAEAGVLGVLPGIVGSVQALETIKLLLGLGEGLSGRLVAFDALDMTFREYRLQRDPNQEVTWENRERIRISELDDLCMPQMSEPPTG
nr:molybdopterin biosynthesis protein MoeB [Acidimicrobiales bacterium]